ncbi:MAG: phosphate signaling complex protein PhoU [Eubacterium sp.]|jgi:phosphate transport system protein
MRIKYEEQLKRLNQEMIQMGNMVEQAIEQSYAALTQGDVERAKQIVHEDSAVNDQERLIENLCLKLILQQQPVASDLRTISAALKMVTDMERIGDHAADISELTIYLADRKEDVNQENIRKMAAETMTMVLDSVDAYVRKDLQEARAVIARDDTVDALFDAVKQDLVNQIAKHPENAGSMPDLLLVAKYFERIGDHAVNIAEWVIYAVTGQELPS